MRKILLSVAALAAATFLSPAVGRAAPDNEKVVKEFEVPKPILEALKKKYPKATTKKIVMGTETDKETKKEVTIYEMDIEDGGTKITVAFTDDEITEEETVLGAADLPKEVQKGIEGSKYSKMTKNKVVKVVKNENDKEPRYSVTFSDGNKAYGVTFDKDGKITKEKEKKKKEDKKEEAPQPGKKDD